MIPKIENINIGDEIEIVEEPTYTWKIEGNRVVGYTDEIEAMEQAIYLILNTERYKHEIYDWNRGIETADLYGKPISYVQPEIKRRVIDALLEDNRINDVNNFTLHIPERNTLATRFVVHTIFGAIHISKEVSI